METSSFVIQEEKKIGPGHSTELSPSWEPANWVATQEFPNILSYTQTSLDLGIQLWGTASTSNIEILERFQSKALRMIVDAPRYVPNTVMWRDLQIPTVKKKSAATALNTVLASVQIIQLT
jgi:hypothetical protein